jgi:hypothetical protein
MNTPRLLFGLLLAALTVAVAPAADAGGKRPVVVELFTSQGCSSCPPADAVIGHLADRKDVLALTLPVTYWDMLGWKDTLASDGNTRRQKAYAAAMGRGGVYTPQMIVDGATDVVGSREQAVDAAIVSRGGAADQDRRGRRRTQSQRHNLAVPHSRPRAGRRRQRRERRPYARLPQYRARRESGGCVEGTAHFARSAACGNDKRTIRRHRRRRAAERLWPRPGRGRNLARRLRHRVVRIA